MSKLLETLIKRMDELIERSGAIQKQVKTKQGSRSADIWGNKEGYSWEEYPEEASRIWQQHFTTLVHMILREGSPNFDRAIRITTYNDQDRALDEGRVFLIALREDLSGGYLTPIFHQIDSEITVDYLDMANALLAEGKTKQEHVPAAVLAGAILERGLRTLCERQSPPLPILDKHGDKKMLNPLIDELKKANVFNELKAKQLRAWADIRNAAAHGEFEKFKRADVEGMLTGITQFLADQLG